MSDLDVWKKRTRSGLLRQESIHSFSFTYNEQSSLPVSISMPTTKLRREFNEVPPAFQACMPEGELLKEIVSYLEEKLKRNVDEMDVLAAVGNNNIGILGFTMPGQAIKPVNKVFSPDSINAADDELSAFNQAMGEFFLSGVSGVQPKFLAKSLPMNNLIVKSYDPYEYPASTVVEHVCMELAGKLGLNVAKTRLSKQGHVLFVERFDKDGDVYGDMEEICSVLSLGTSKKYDGTYEKVAKAIGRIDSDSLEPLFKQIVFHNLVRNGDAHLKNFAILDGKLSPMYDVLCTAAWGDHQLALYLGGSKRWGEDKALVRFGQEFCGLTVKGAKSTIADMKEGLISELGFIDDYASQYSGLRHIEPVLKNLKEHLLCGCGKKLQTELSLVSIQELLKNDRQTQTFKDAEGGNQRL